MCPGAGDTAKRWCGGSWKVWGERGVTVQHAPWGQSTDGAAPSSSCSVPGTPLKKFSCTSKCVFLSPACAQGGLGGRAGEGGQP